MIDLSTYHQGFVAGFVPGLALGLGLMKTAWEHSERRRRVLALKVRSKPTRELLFFDGPIARSNNGLGPTTPKPDITPVGQQPIRRVYHYNPATIAECGGPCQEGGPGACDCGAITWTDRPVKPEFPPPRKISGDVP